MGSLTIKNILDELAKSNSRKTKLSILNEHKENETLKKVVYLAAHPLVNFFIQKIPEYKQRSNPKLDLSEAIRMTIELHHRLVTGNKAIDHLAYILSNVDFDDAEVIKRIINKNLKCGVSIATINSVWPKLIQTYPCLLASSYSYKLFEKIKFPAFTQLKMDGMRFNAIVNNGVCEFRSRSGREIMINHKPLYDDFIKMSKGNNVVFDGELVVSKDSDLLDRKTGNGILNKAIKGTQNKQEGLMVRAVLWDCIEYHKFEKGKDNTKYTDRLKVLEEFIKQTPSKYISLIETSEVFSPVEVKRNFDKAITQGQEGIILKTMDHPWENRRSKNLIKFKNELECDLKVVDWIEGKGKYKGQMGSILCMSDDAMLEVNVGSGFTDNERLNIKSEDIVGKIVSVKYNEKIQTKDSNDTYSLFLPVFVEIREDKTKADTMVDIS